MDQKNRVRFPSESNEMKLALTVTRAGYRPSAGSIRYSVLISAIQKFARRGEWDKAKPVAAALAVIVYKDRSNGYKSNITNIINRLLVIIMEDMRCVVDIRRELTVLRNPNAPPLSVSAAVIGAVRKLTRPGMVKSRRCSAYKAMCKDVLSKRMDQIKKYIGDTAPHSHILKMRSLLFGCENLTKSFKPKSKTRADVVAYLEGNIRAIVPRGSLWAYDWLISELKITNHREWFLFPIRAALLAGEISQGETPVYTPHAVEFISTHFKGDWKPPAYVVDMHTGKRKDSQGVNTFLTEGIKVDNSDQRDTQLRLYYIEHKRVHIARATVKKPKRAKIEYPGYIRTGKGKTRVTHIEGKDIRGIRFTRAQLPCGSKPGTWLGGGYFVKEIFSANRPAFALEMDSIKGKFGLRSCNMRFTDGLLVGDDLGGGFEYQTNPHGRRPDVRVVDDARAAQPVGEIKPTEVGEILTIMLWRCLYSISDTHLRNMVRLSGDSKGRRFASVDENCPRQGFPDTGKSGWRVLFIAVPDKKRASVIDAWWDSGGRDMIVSKLRMFAQVECVPVVPKNSVDKLMVVL